MEEQEKYYTPEMSELFIGYEYEHEDMMKGDDNPNDPNGKYWVKDIIKSVRADDNIPYDYEALETVWDLNEVFVRNTFRTKYLDREDCESLEWIYKEVTYRKEWDILPLSDKSKLVNCLCFEKENAWLIIRPNNRIEIMAIDICKEMDKGILSYNSNNGLMFSGECKSINELRKIQKWLQIK